MGFPTALSTSILSVQELLNSLIIAAPHTSSMILELEAFHAASPSSGPRRLRHRRRDLFDHRRAARNRRRPPCHGRGGGVAGDHLRHRLRLRLAADRGGHRWGRAQAAADRRHLRIRPRQPCRRSRAELLRPRCGAGAARPRRRHLYARRRRLRHFAVLSRASRPSDCVDLRRHDVGDRRRRAGRHLPCVDRRVARAVLRRRRARGARRYRRRRCVAAADRPAGGRLRRTARRPAARRRAADADPDRAGVGRPIRRQHLHGRADRIGARRRRRSDWRWRWYSSASSASSAASSAATRPTGGRGSAS